jgi:hypothetical protein
MTVGSIDEGILNIFVPTENSAAEIEHNYSDDFAIATEQVFKLPVRGQTYCQATFRIRLSIDWH